MQEGFLLYFLEFFYSYLSVVGCWSFVSVGGACLLLVVGCRLSIGDCRLSNVAVRGFFWLLSFCVAEAQFCLCPQLILGN